MLVLEEKYCALRAKADKAPIHFGAVETPAME
jgi:hypothetical protein